MKLDKLTVNVRPLQSFQAVDLGMMMARDWFLPLWGLWWRRMLPIVVLMMGLMLLRAGFGLFQGLGWSWLMLMVWWLKPYAEVPLVLYLSQKLFDATLAPQQAWQQLDKLSIKDSLLLTTHYRFTMRRQMLIPILVLERQSQRQMRERLQVLTQSQNNAITWHTLGFVMIEQLLYIGLVVLLIQLLPQTVIADLPWQEWLTHAPWQMELVLMSVYLLVVSGLTVFYIASGFAIYICKRSLLEGWDIELRFRKLARRHDAIRQAQITATYASYQSSANASNSSANTRGQS